MRVEDAVGGETGMLRWFEVKVYGEGTSIDAAARNDTYHYTDEFLATAALAGQAGRTTLADSGGIDWIDGAAVTGNFTLNLGQNVFSTVNGANWFKIAAGTTIENAVTGDGNDVIIGNGAANTLYGMRGNDVAERRRRRRRAAWRQGQRCLCRRQRAGRRRRARRRRPRHGAIVAQLQPRQYGPRARRSSRT